MIVQMLVGIAGPDISVTPGGLLNCDDPSGRRLVKSHQAIEITLEEFQRIQREELKEFVDEQKEELETFHDVQGIGPPKSKKKPKPKRQ